MILYFSATGNSEYAAKRLARQTGDSLLSLNEIIKAGSLRECPDFCSMSSQPMIFVTPTYAWRIPRIVSEQIEKMTFSPGQPVYFVMTCGSEIGNAEKYLKALYARKKLTYMGCLSLPMPENYIALFDVPSEAECGEFMVKAEKTLCGAAERIMAHTPFGGNKVGFGDVLRSGVVNDVFYPVVVSAKKFYATQGCVGCGKCAELCPLNNIKIVDGKPTWGKNCTHCMACICRCPTEAIEYGQKSVGKRRYVCGKVLEPK